MLRGMADSPSYFGKKLVEARKAVGLSGNKLAQLARVDQATLSKIERGERGATDDFIRKIAPHLELEVDLLNTWRAIDFLGGQENFDRMTLRVMMARSAANQAGFELEQGSIIDRILSRLSLAEAFIHQGLSELEVNSAAWKHVNDARKAVEEAIDVTALNLPFFVTSKPTGVPPEGV